MTREALHIVEKQCFPNQNPEKYFDVIQATVLISIEVKNTNPVNSITIHIKSNQLKYNRVPYNSKLSDVDPLICDDLLPLSSSNNSDDEQESEYMKNINFKNNLRTWALQKNIGKAALNDLL